METAGQAGEGGMTMKKKIWMAALCAAMLLTGCGIPDAVADECRRVARSAGFAGSAEDKAAFQRAVRRSEGQWEPAVISADREQKIDSLVEFLEKKAAAGTIRLLESAFSKSDISDAGEEDEDDAEGDLSGLRTWKTDIETEKKGISGGGGASGGILLCQRGSDAGGNTGLIPHRVWTGGAAGCRYGIL